MTIDDLTLDEKRDMTTVQSTIYVERDSQKGIIVGQAAPFIGFAPGTCFLVKRRSQ